MSSDVLRSSGGTGLMNSLIKSAEILWATPCARWLHPMEMLAMQGFPVFRCMQGADYPCCSFNAQPAMSRSRNSITDRAGNSMHVSVVAAVWVYVTLFFERDNADENAMRAWLSTHDLTLHGEEL